MKYIGYILGRVHVTERLHTRIPLKVSFQCSIERTTARQHMK